MVGVLAKVAKIVNRKDSYFLDNSILMPVVSSHGRWYNANDVLAPVYKELGLTREKLEKEKPSISEKQIKDLDDKVTVLSNECKRIEEELNSQASELEEIFKYKAYITRGVRKEFRQSLIILEKYKHRNEIEANYYAAVYNLMRAHGRRTYLEDYMDTKLQHSVIGSFMEAADCNGDWSETDKNIVLLSLLHSMYKGVSSLIICRDNHLKDILMHTGGVFMKSGILDETQLSHVKVVYAKCKECELYTFNKHWKISMR